MRSWLKLLMVFALALGTFKLVVVFSREAHDMMRVLVFRAAEFRGDSAKQDEALLQISRARAERDGNLDTFEYGVSYRRAEEALLDLEQRNPHAVDHLYETVRILRAQDPHALPVDEADHGSSDKKTRVAGR